MMKCRRTRCLASATIVLAAVLANVAAAQASTVLTTGKLTGPDGSPAPGDVRVYAWPVSRKAMDLPLVGSGHARADGSFEVLIDDDQRLLRLAAQRNGWLDFSAVADVPGRQGEWTFTAFVSRDVGQVRVVPADSVSRAGGVARAAAFSAAPAIGLKATRVLPQVASTAQAGRCKNKREVTKPVYTREWAVVGELNNAYNDGTWGRFRYGRSHGAETEFGIAASYGPSVWTIGGTNTVTDEGWARFPTVRRRYARRLRSQFEFSKQSARNNTCAVWDTYIRATAWDGGNNDDIRQKSALDRCDPDYVARWTGDSGFERHRSEAVRWTAGVQAWGVNLTTKSGFSDDVTLEYGFKGGLKKGHYICGPDGRQSPFTAGRVFSGAIK